MYLKILNLLIYSVFFNKFLRKYYYQIIKQCNVFLKFLYDKS